jgi:hypothetical protein
MNHSAADQGVHWAALPRGRADFGILRALPQWNGGLPPCIEYRSPVARPIQYTPPPAPWSDRIIVINCRGISRIDRHIVADTTYPLRTGSPLANMFIPTAAVPGDTSPSPAALVEAFRRVFVGSESAEAVATDMETWCFPTLSSPSTRTAR